MALDEFEDALGDLATSAAASLWVRGALDDGRFDRPERQASAGTFARSSERATANGAPLDRASLIAYCRELVEPPAAPQPRHLEHATTAQA